MENKTCRRCHTRQPIDNFSRDKYRKDGRVSHCKECQAEKWAAKPGRPHKPRKEYETPKEKKCSGCAEVLPASHFHVRRDRGNGKALQSKCKQCTSKIFKQWSDKNPGSSRKRNLKKKYGIDEETYFKMLEDQGGGCGICGSTESGWKTSPWLHVDHCHTSGTIRGLLCHQCNIMIGCLEVREINDLTKVSEWLNR